MRATSPLSVALAIAATSLRRLSRDRLGLFFIVVLPFLIILLFGGGARPSAAEDVSLGVQGGEGQLAAELRAELETADGLAVTGFDDREELESAVRRGRLDAGLVIPADFDQQVTAGEVAEVELLADPSGLPAGSQGTVGAAMAALEARLTTAQVGVETLGLDFEAALASAETLDVPGVSVQAETVGEADTVGAGNAAAGNLVLFVFVTSLVGGAWLVESRRLGVSRRMLGTPTTAAAILAGEALGRFTLALGQALLVVFGAAWLFGVDWGQPLALAAVVGLFALCGTGAAMLFGATFDRPEQAGAIAPPLGIALGMLGGCMWPLEIVPPFMRVVGHAIPHGWAMDAVTAVVAEGAGVTDVAGELAVLAGFAAVLLALAAWRLHRALTR